MAMFTFTVTVEVSDKVKQPHHLVGGAQDEIVAWTDNSATWTVGEAKKI